jgi:hypothetical protein
MYDYFQYIEQEWDEFQRRRQQLGKYFSPPPLLA